MPTALPDILSSDGRFIYMRSQQFDMEGNRPIIATANPHNQLGEGRHLFSPVGFTDDTWFHRSYWIYGKSHGSGWGGWALPGQYTHYGRILVFDDEKVYGYQRDPEYVCNSTVLEYRLFGAERKIKPERLASQRSTDLWNFTIRNVLPDSALNPVDYDWINEHPPLLAHAMVLTGERLFFAGPPDVVNEEETWKKYHISNYREKLQQQKNVLEREQGALLWAVSAPDGAKLAEYKLGSFPIFDGMAAADGKLFMTMKDGTVLCMSGD
jgi:hypothetical protein